MGSITLTNTSTLLWTYLEVMMDCVTMNAAMVTNQNPGLVTNHPHPMDFDIGIPSLTKCCNQHDRCYDTCNRDKHDCDDEFQECLETISCENTVTLLFEAVMHMGCKPYMDSQRDSCICKFEVKRDL
ncbi:unnamed protein product [Coregonus sp. 'balchen']|nr:unnamed protein product [Coregonus sp. 'balchen']